MRPRIHGRTIRAAVTLLLLATFSSAQPAHKPLDLRAPVQDKNFYALSLLERQPEVAKALASEESLAGILELKRVAVERAASSCKTVSCFDEAMRWSDTEISSAADGLKKLYGSSAAVRSLVDHALRESGAYIRYDAKPGDELLAQAWMDAAAGMNHAIDVYGEGHPPRTSTDASAFDVSKPGYEQMVHTVAYLLAEESAEMKLFFQPTLRYSLQLLDINKRDEAGRLEPLEQKENAVAVKHIRSIDWSRYPYTVIVVPGAGSDRTTWALSPAGKLRVEIAARRWKAKKAPLILVSGGFVHPSQTPYSEAVEMKKALMADFGVPEDAILIDPHARHTTTNLRNAARIMYRDGVPFERTALITTDSFQSSYIENDGFAARCVKEMGYVPYQLGRRLSVFDLEWTPKLESLQIDPVGDLLDP